MFCDQELCFVEASCLNFVFVEAPCLRPGIMVYVLWRAMFWGDPRSFGPGEMVTSTPPPPSSVRDVLLLDVSVLEVTVLEVPPGTDMSPAARSHYTVVSLA